MRDVPADTIELGKKRLPNRDVAEANELMAGAWAEALASDRMRRAAATALGIEPAQLDGSKPPFTITVPSGFEPGTATLIGHYALTYVAGPVAVGLAKDIVKEGLLKVWRDVLLPLIRKRKENVIVD